MTRSPRTRSGRFVNYSRTVRTAPMAWRAPSSEEEIADCATAGARVRVVGAGHSFSPVAAPEGIAVTLDRFAGIVSRRDGEVTVRAGTRLRDLSRALACDGETLPIVGSIMQQSVAGAVGTGTHGSSLVHGNLSSLVRGARLITGEGAALQIGPDDERLDAVRVHLGALGIVTELTLATVPAFRLQQTIERVPLEAVAARVQEIGASAEYAKVWWLPHTGRALVFRYERTRAPAMRRTSAERVVDDWLVHRAALPVANACLRRLPAATPVLNATFARALAKGPRVAAGPLMLTTPDPARHHETEASVPLAAGGEALERTVAMIERLRLRVSHLVELRYVRGDGGWMSPAHGRDSVHLGAYTGLPPRPYFDAFWTEMRALGARPHWGKEMDHDAAEIRALYPRAGDFAALSDALDPAHRFRNAFLDRILGASPLAD